MNRRLINFRSAIAMAGALLIFSVLVSSCVRHGPSIDANAYAAEIERWHQERWKELNGESGWLTLVGLFWLKDGENKFGSDAKNDIVLSNAKLKSAAGSFWLQNGVVRLEAMQPGLTLDGKPVSSLELTTDADNHPTVLHLDSLSLQVIKRGDKLGLRVKDSQNPDRLNFKGTEFYPANLKWRIEGQFEAYNPPKPLSIKNVLGMESAEGSPGAIKFKINGQEHRLDAMTEKGEPRLFIIIADKTSGKETYPAGRYLYVDPPDSAGRLVIDFNKSYSPPCAFTKFATCPLPPNQNRLPIAIEAGEKYRRHEN
jgi:uncharacterized protein (DUF1684 family)